jgi:hypothetical protein
MAASMKFWVFWDILPCSQIDVDRRFRDACCLHHQDNEWALCEKIAGYIGVQVDWADQWGMGYDRWRSGLMGGRSKVEDRERGIVWEWDRIEFGSLQGLDGSRDDASKWSGNNNGPNRGLSCPKKDSWDNLLLEQGFLTTRQYIPEDSELLTTGLTNWPINQPTNHPTN